MGGGRRQEADLCETLTSTPRGQAERQGWQDCVPPACHTGTSLTPGRVPRELCGEEHFQSGILVSYWPSLAGQVLCPLGYAVPPKQGKSCSGRAPVPSALTFLWEQVVGEDTDQLVLTLTTHLSL